MFKIGDRVMYKGEESVVVAFSANSTITIHRLKADVAECVFIDRLEKVITPNDVIEAYEGSVYYGIDALRYSIEGWRMSGKVGFLTNYGVHYYLMEKQKPKENPLLKELEEESKKAMEHLNNINKKIEEIKGEE